jgi:hypothetical protein
MSFGKKVDWKEFLSPEAEKTLKWILDRSKSHRGAYLNAEDVKTAQLWAAMIEFTKYIQNFNERLTRLEKEMSIGPALREDEKEDIRKSLEQF